VSQSTSDRLSNPEVDLAYLQASQRLDRYLVELAGLSGVGLGTVLGVLVGGTTIIGRLVPDIEMAKAMDDHLSSMLQLAKRAAGSPEEEQLLADVDTSPHQKAAEERQAAKTSLRERVEAEVGDGDIEPTKLPEDLARRLAQDSSPPALTLADASVLPPGAKAAITVPILRVAIRQVGGWWIVPTDPETGQASFSYPT
jgi:hypothetical protein